MQLNLTKYINTMIYNVFPTQGMEVMIDKFE